MQALEKKAKSKRPATRSLKINRVVRINRRSTNASPEIKLYGNWLQQLGFVPEQRVNITTMNKLLIIQPEE